MNIFPYLYPKRTHKHRHCTHAHKHTHSLTDTHAHTQPLPSLYPFMEARSTHPALSALCSRLKTHSVSITAPPPSHAHAGGIPAPLTPAPYSFQVTTAASH